MWRVGLQDQAKKQNEKPIDRKNKAAASSKTYNKAVKDSILSSDSPKRARPQSVTIAEQPTNRRFTKIDYHQTTFMAARTMTDKRISTMGAQRPTSDENSIRRQSTSSENLLQRRSSTSFNYNVIKEIRARVKKVVTEFEAAPGGMIQDEDILRDIQENLPSIQDDMLRINVTALLSRYRQISELQEQSVADTFALTPNTSEKQDLLISVHNWMEEERMKSLEDLDEEYFLMPDTQLIEEYMDSVQSTVKKISQLKDKIDKCKAIGANPDFLEKQSKNLKRQMKEEILNKEYKKISKGNKGTAKKQEFTYLKNAATEIYNLLRKTRTEGSEEKKKFEEELAEILKMVEEKDKLVAFLEKRIDQQTKLVMSWCNDYEKLQGEYIIMEGQAQIERNEKVKINESLEEYKEKLKAIEQRYQQNFIPKSEHVTQMNACDQKMRLLKQQNEIMAYNLREKDFAMDEHARQIQMLKAALRRGSEAAYRSAISATSVKINDAPVPAPPCVSLTQISTTNIIQAKATESLLMLEIDALKKKLDVLTDENKQLKVQMYQQANSQISMMSAMSRELVSPSSSNASVTPTPKERGTSRGSTTVTAARSSRMAASSRSSRMAAQKGSNLAGTQKPSSKTPIQKQSGDSQRTLGKPQKTSIKAKLSKQSTATEMKTIDESTVLKAPESTKVDVVDRSAQTEFQNKSVYVDTFDLHQIDQKNIGVQVNSLISRSSVVAELTENERLLAFEALRRLNDSLGIEWKQNALNISKLKPADVEEFAALMSSERDVKSMWTSLESNEPDEKVSGVIRPSTPPGKKTEMNQSVKKSSPITKHRNESTSSEDKRRSEENKISSHDQFEETIEPQAADSRIKLTKEDLKTCTVSDSVAVLTESMLSGKIPNEIQVVDKGVEHILHEAESMTFKIGNFIDKVQGYIGCQTDMMQQANDAIKEALPEDLKIVVEEAEPDVEAQNSSSGVFGEYSEDWKHMSAAEQVQCKLKGVEEVMRDMVHESMNVFVGEVVKQHAAYSRIHEVVNEKSPDQAGFGFVADKKHAVQSIKQRVEASMRSMARINRAQRKKIGLYVDKRKSFEEPYVRKIGVMVEGTPMSGQPKSSLTKLLRLKSPAPKFGANAISTLIDSQLSGKRIRKSEQLHDRLLNGANKSSPSIKGFRQRLKSAAKKQTKWKQVRNASQIHSELANNPIVLVEKLFGKVSGRQAPPSPIENHRSSDRRSMRKASKPATMHHNGSSHDVIRPVVTLSAIRDQLHRQSRLTLPKQPGIADSVFRVNSFNFYPTSRPRSNLDGIDSFVSHSTPSYHPPSPTVKLPVL